MCGIAGLTWRDGEAVTRMTDAIAHRGPDDSGLYQGEPVTLGHRRLTIIDLSSDGHQPMTDPQGLVTLTYNGEIYNYRELREQLVTLGHQFRSSSDTEVLLHAYLQWGEACVERLNGMFAFAIWDSRDRSMLLVRDRLGVKPLYYAEVTRPDLDGTQLVFASEIKGILASGAVSREIDRQSLYYFMGYEYVPGRRTIFRDVHELEPGCLLRWKDGKVTQRRYWELDLTPKVRTNDEYKQLLREQLRRSTQMQLVADVPVGVFLSGGLDSTALVAFASEIGPMRSFSMGYADRSYSELEYARHVAEHYGTTHEEVLASSMSPETLERVVWHLDEPMSDLSTAAFFMLCEKVRPHVKVCLSGEGGDEAMAGYDRFKASRLNAAYTRIPGFIRHGLIEPAVLGLRDRPTKKGAVNVLKRFVEGAHLPADGGHLRWQYFMQPEIEGDLFRPELLNDVTRDPFAPVRDVFARSRWSDRVTNEIFIDTSLSMPSSVLDKVDKMSMAHGLEVRVPFLDHEYVELCATIPSSKKLRGMTTRAIYREAMAGVLPDKVIRRKKQGYSLPVKNWLRGDLEDYMRGLMRESPVIHEFFQPATVTRLMDEHRAMQANHSHLLWSLINLAVWDRLFLHSAAERSAA
ncbi:MAG: asparagine synthase (glutamine-hydrolyzing) [Phycisphaera sp.]|nr:asparagine synthase (glutamine-hydrolyzing) [Phycisphaera sp.]